MGDVSNRKNPSSRDAAPSWLFQSFLIAGGALVALALLYAFIFGPRNAHDQALREFVVVPGESPVEIATALHKEGFIRHPGAFVLALMVSGAPKIGEGGYQVAPSFDVWMLVRTMTESPYLTWVVIPEALRKEEVVEHLAEEFAWNDASKEEYLRARAVLPAFEEGVYASGTYLMPSDIEPALASARMRTTFEEMLYPFLERVSLSDLSLKEVLTFASIVERESSRTDKRLVAGILHNRLAQGMKLQADATMQYVTGSPEEGWWHAPEPDDKYIESPYNTYYVTGLPPAPIATPSAESIEAVLDPEPTSCLYYLHDSRGRIHCSRTYQEHLSNIKNYL